MTKDDIIRMAREAGLHIATDVNWMPIIGLEYLERFFNLATAYEREECAKAIEAEHGMNPDWKKHLVTAIRARGQA